MNIDDMKKYFDAMGNPVFDSERPVAWGGVACLECGSNIQGAHYEGCHKGKKERLAQAIVDLISE
jgi:hypothetical protein